MLRVSKAESVLAIRELLLTDQALMRMTGFNAAHGQHGSTERGLSLAT